MQFNHTGFIAQDPISIPHQYTLLQDIEIAGLWTAVLSWGQRPVILSKAAELMALMAPSPYQFIMQHTEEQRESFINFRHRTFNFDDSLAFLHVLQQYYRQHQSLESLFSQGIEQGLHKLHSLWADDPLIQRRSLKHISTPYRKAACKRINMFLRWMVRQDASGVDFGVWKNINPAALYIPLDLHVGRIARGLGLLQRRQDDWQAVCELTAQLRRLDPALSLIHI